LTAELLSKSVVVGTVPSFVGRADEVAQIAARLHRGAAGRGGFVLLVGDAGIGKTALIDECLGVAQRLGFRVAATACWQTAAVAPLRPWTQLLTQLAEPGSVPVDLATEIGDPDIARAEQFRLVTTEVLRHASSPLLLVLDDLHWADSATLGALDHLAAAAPAHPLVVLAAARPADAAAAFAEAAAALRRRGMTLNLVGLAATDTAALARAVSAGPIDDAHAAWIHRTGGGNPLVTRELALAGPPEADSLDGGPLAVPALVQALVGERIGRLTPLCRDMLSWLAVAGDAAPVDVLATVLATTPAALLEPLDEAHRAGLVGPPGTEVAFAHALFRAGVYSGLTLVDRVARHAALAQLLLARRDAGAPVELAALAHHFGRAAPLGHHADAFRFVAAAAAEAADLMAFDVSVRRYRQALALLELQPTLGARLPLVLELADAQLASGDFDGAHATYATALADARSAGDATAFGRAAIGFSGGLTGIAVIVGDPAVRDALSEAAALLDGDDVLGPVVEARLSTAAWVLAPLDERRALAERALQRAEAGGDPASVAHALSAWCDVIAGPDHLAERRAAADRLIAGALAARDPRAETVGRRLRVEALFESGELVLAEVEAARYERAAERLGRPEFDWYPVLWRTALAFVRGDREAHARWRGELGRRVAGGGPNAELLAEVHDVISAMDLRDRAATARSMGRFLGTDAAMFDVSYQVAIERWTSIVNGTPPNRAEVRTLTEGALALERDSEWQPTMAQHAESVAAASDVESAAALAEALAPFARQWVVEGIGAGVRGPVARWLGILAAVMGDRRAAQQHFADAHAAAAAAGAELIVALIADDRARALGEPAPAAARAALELWGATGRLEPGGELPLVADPGDAAPTNRFVRVGETWLVGSAGTTCSLRHSKGLGDLARLLAEPGREIAALDLTTPGSAIVETDTGPRLDDQARADYRRRLAAIEWELDLADERGDAGGSARLTAERDALLAELRAATGLGGRARREGASSERARTAVRARVNDAMKRIEAVDPALGRHLRQSVRTGTFCVYHPDPPVDWHVRTG